MRKIRFSEEQIIAILREQETGRPTAEVCRRHGISQPTFYIYGWLSRCKRLERVPGELGCQHLSGVTRNAGAPKWVIRAA